MDPQRSIRDWFAGVISTENAEGRPTPEFVVSSDEAIEASGTDIVLTDAYLIVGICMVPFTAIRYVKAISCTNPKMARSFWIHV